MPTERADRYGAGGYLWVIRFDVGHARVVVVGEVVVGVVGAHVGPF
jgi:hypothetical protein